MIMFPLILLVIELILSKIRVPLRHVILNVIFTGFYLLVTYLYEVIPKTALPVYPNNLNWTCKVNRSYLVDLTSDT